MSDSLWNQDTHLTLPSEIAPVLQPPAVPVSPQPISMGELAPGTLLGGRYRIEGQIGRGGFAETYRAEDWALPTPRLCVVKRIVFRDSVGAEQHRAIGASLANEARLLSSLNTPGHENIPEIYDYLPGEQCLVIKFIEGESLGSMISRRGEPLDSLDALRYIHDACSAVAYLHSRRVLHHDIKPDNLLVDSRARLWVIDFGIGAFGRVDAPGDMLHGTPIGLSPGYAPEEQRNGVSEPRTDVYALGATLYYLLTARRPPPDRSPEAVRLLRPEVSPEVEALIARATAPRPEDRPTATELLAQLALLCSGLRIEPPAPVPDMGELIGREAECARYLGGLQRSRRIVISGMAGLGKTALAAELARRADASSRRFWHRVLAGEGVGTVLRKLAEFLAWNGSRGLWELRYAHGIATSTALEPGEEIDLLSGLLRGRGDLICLDDAHHLASEPAGAALLTRLAELAGQGHLTLIVTAREHLTMVSDEPALPPLAPADAHALIARLGPSAIAADLRERLVTRLGGNAQCLRLAVGLLAHAPDVASLIAALPETPQVAGYLMEQIFSRLDSAEQVVMEALAVIGDRGGTRVAIEALLDRTTVRRVAVLPTLLRLQSRDLLVAGAAGADGVTYYQHAIVQDFCYSMLNGSRRAVLHRRAVAHYERPGGSPLRATSHAVLAGEWRRAAALATAYAPLAPGNGDADALLTLLGSLTSHRLDRTGQIAVALARGDLAALLRRPGEASVAYQEALAALKRAPAGAERDLNIAHACLGMATLLEQTSVEEALAWVQQGAAAAADHPPAAARLERRRGSILFLAGEHQAAREALAAALDLAPPDDLGTRGDAALDLGNLACMDGDFVAGRTLFATALACYEQIRDTWRMLPVLQNLAQLSEISSGAWEQASAEYERVQALAEGLGRVETSARVQLARGVLLLNQGRFDPAHATLTAACAYAQSYALDEPRMAALSSLADLALRLDDIAGARAFILEARAIAERSGIVTQLVEITTLEASVALADGALDLALSAATTAARLAREQSANLEQGKALRVIGRARAVAGDRAGALAAFTDGLTLLEDDPYEQARTWLACAEALTPDSPEGARMARDAYETFARLGAAHDLSLAAALMFPAP